MMLSTANKFVFIVVFFFQAEDGIRDLVRSRGLGDVYKRQRRKRALSSITTRDRINCIAPPTLIWGKVAASAPHLSLIHI